MAAAATDGVNSGGRIIAAGIDLNVAWLANVQVGIASNKGANCWLLHLLRSLDARNPPAVWKNMRQLLSSEIHATHPLTWK